LLLHLSVAAFDSAKLQDFFSPPQRAQRRQSGFNDVRVIA
jgi:hypothetical protein